ncbi:SLAP domain-containing protein [Lactobacillus sp. ESL0785]|uniref:SLAP domain-containing protein n=1 Tax=Lactobacillus sp. ESL0785 TaxID=2983232 RepID=UPI0023F83EA0|nr:SLAP domain-containing protein [Lactobacillus sp. ESL0785]WEV70357.1 SLAP domain-containing protein [Lactobacillus sp. ESL0785]
MKLTKKLNILLAVMLLGSPCLTMIQSQKVQAVKKTPKNTLEIIDSPFIYQANGKRYRYYDSIPGVTLDINTDRKGYAHLDCDSDDNEFHYTGQTALIKGKKYYRIAKNAYINAKYVIGVNGKNLQKGKLMLNHNSNIYHQNGKKTGKTLTKDTLVTYADRRKTTTKIPKYFYYISNQQYGYLPTHKIHGKDYYALGNNQYINAKNIGRINGTVAHYNGITTAVVTANTTTQYISNIGTNHQLKKGQKVKIDRTVTPWAEDFDGYIYHLHDYPDEYLDQSLLKLRNDPPIADYNEMAYRTFSSTSNAPIKLYSNLGTELSKPLTPLKDEAVSADGLFYLWNNKTQKAELFYHLFRQNNDVIPASDPERMTFSNSFVKADAIKFTNNYITLKPLNSPQDAQADQVTATTADKKELAQLFMAGQKNLNAIAIDASLKNNYENALGIAAVTLRSTSVSRGEVKEVIWLVKTTKKQLQSLYFEDWS